ncbi:MAG: alpha/beta hydrolase [Verrucomicrobia bacterium]|nr:alpha/beta hydrolase [Verrucomicrobiota bacterium]
MEPPYVGCYQIEMNFAEHRTSSAPALRFIGDDAPRPTLLLLHGVTRCAEDFQPIFAALTPHWRIIALDHRGHGGSERAASYLVTDFVADAVRFVRDELAAPLFILGHSLGAMVAAAVAAELPQLVRGVVLEDPPFHTMGSHIHSSVWQAQFIGTREAARRGGNVEQLTDALADIRLPFPGGVTKRLGDLRDRAALRWGAECLAKLDPEVLTPLIEGRWLDGYDTAGIAARVRCPALLLQADTKAGGALSDEDAQLFTRTASNCRLEKFPGSGHLLHWLQPARVAELVNEFALSTMSRLREKIPRPFKSS